MTADWRPLVGSLHRELVPSHGEAATVQGELIRCLGNLSDECFRNGNGNWDERHVAMTRFVERTLDDPATFGDADRAALRAAVVRVLDADNPDTDENGAHSVLARLAVEWCRRHLDLIPRSPSGAGGRIRSFAAPSADPARRVPPPANDPMVVTHGMGGKLDDLRALLDAGASPDSMHSDGFTALHWAARRGNLAMMDLLLDRGANPDLRASAQMLAPLWFAADEGKLDAVKRLIAAGADVHAPNALGTTALHKASSHHELPTAIAMSRALCAAGADPDRRNDRGVSVLDNANRLVAAAMFETLHRENDFAAPPPAGNDPRLPWIAAEGDVAELTRRLDAGASPRSVAAPALTALYAACRMNRVAAAELLLARGADANGEKVLLLAVLLPSLPLVRALLAAGASVRTEGGGDVLGFARVDAYPTPPDDLAIVELLLAAGCDPSKKPDAGHRKGALAESKGKIKKLLQKHVAERGGG